MWQWQRFCYCLWLDFDYRLHPFRMGHILPPSPLHRPLPFVWFSWESKPGRGKSLCNTWDSNGHYHKDTISAWHRDHRQTSSRLLQRPQRCTTGVRGVDVVVNALGLIIWTVFFEAWLSRLIIKRFNWKYTDVCWETRGTMLIIWF